MVIRWLFHRKPNGNVDFGDQACYCVQVQEHKRRFTLTGELSFFMPGGGMALKPHHLKALELLKENAMSVTEVAKASSISPDHLYDLIEGNVSKAGNIAAEFSKEYEKIYKELGKRTQSKMRSLKDKLVDDLYAWNEHINKKGSSKLTMSEVRTKKSILAELNKAEEGVNIEQFHYHTGLAGEDLVNEFKRIKSAVELAAHGRRVPPTEQRGSGVLPIPLEAKAQRSQGEEAAELLAQSETGEVPQEPELHQDSPGREPEREDDVRGS